MTEMYCKVHIIYYRYTSRYTFIFCENSDSKISNRIIVNKRKHKSYTNKLQIYERYIKFLTLQITKIFHRKWYGLFDCIVILCL